MIGRSSIGKLAGGFRDVWDLWQRRAGGVVQTGVEGIVLERIARQGASRSVLRGRLAAKEEAAPVTAPAEPPVVRVIEPQPSCRIIRLAELWRFRELLYFLTWRDVKVRYKQTVLGAMWAIVQPLGTMIVFSIFLGRLMRSPAGLPYPLFVLAGLLPWSFFSHAVSSAAASVVGSERLVTKVYFPRLMLPASAVAAGLVDFAIAFGMLAAMMLHYGASPGAGVLVLPIVVLGLVVAALGVGTLLAALTVAYRDFRFVVPFLMQLWLFLTPGIYLQAEGVIDPRWQLALPLNPVHGLTLNFRQALLGGPLDWYSLGVSCGASLVFFLIGCAYFSHAERDFADLI